MSSMFSKLIRERIGDSEKEMVSKEDVESELRRLVEERADWVSKQSDLGSETRNILLDVNISKQDDHSPSSVAPPHSEVLDSEKTDIEPEPATVASASGKLGGLPLSGKANK